MMTFKNLLLPALTSVVILLNSSCMKSPYYQNYATIPHYQWHYNFKPAFTFDIDDTAAAYQIYFIIRHTNAYPFSNIWMQVQTRYPDTSKIETSRIEIPLAEPSGKWMGRGMNEIWEQRMPLTKDDKPMIFNNPGAYTLRLQQDMRLNPLPEILQVGIRLEKVPKPKNPMATMPASRPAQPS